MKRAAIWSRKASVVSPWTESWRWAFVGPCPSWGSRLRFCCRRARRGRRWSRACRETRSRTGNKTVKTCIVCVCVCSACRRQKSVVLLPAVFEDKQDVVSEGVSVLLQDPTHVIKHLKHKMHHKTEVNTKTVKESRTRKDFADVTAGLYEVNVKFIIKLRFEFRSQICWSTYYNAATTRGGLQKNCINLIRKQ